MSLNTPPPEILKKHESGGVFSGKGADVCGFLYVFYGAQCVFWSCITISVFFMRVIAPNSEFSVGTVS